MVEERALIHKVGNGIKKSDCKTANRRRTNKCIAIKTLRQIENEFDGEVPSRAIADAIMLRLKNVDGVACLIC